MQLDLWMLRSFLLPASHNGPSSSHHHPLPNYYAMPHNHTVDLCVACLPKADGHQTKSSKDCVQGDNRKNLQ
jgi:hypothetical protein